MEEADTFHVAEATSTITLTRGNGDYYYWEELGEPVYMSDARACLPWWRSLY